MNTTKNYSPYLAAVATAIAFALCLYFALYLGLLIRKPIALEFTSGGNIYFSPPAGYYPEYKFGGRTSETLFVPIQKLDRNLFPSRWNAPPPSAHPSSPTTPPSAFSP